MCDICNRGVQDFKSLLASSPRQAHNVFTQHTPRVVDTAKGAQQHSTYLQPRAKEACLPLHNKEQEVQQVCFHIVDRYVCVIHSHYVT